MMQANRVLATLKFFDLQGLPLTLFEVHKFLLADLESLRPRLNEQFELDSSDSEEAYKIAAPVDLNVILKILDDLVREGAAGESQGYYCLPGHEKFITERLGNYAYGIQRERRIRRFLPFMRYIPFVRGVAIGGSQAMGQQTAGSDIDLFIVTDEAHLWLARSFVTFYFQIFGVRRHGDKIANRFCLNHYVAGPRAVVDERDSYNAMEYLRLRSMVYQEGIKKFVDKNRLWIHAWYPQGQKGDAATLRQSTLQRVFEFFFENSFGNWLERQLGRWQLARIKTGEYAVATNQELSFHSKERKYVLLREFFRL